MKGIRTVLSMGMAFVVSAAALAFAGCSKKEEELSYTRAAYQKYLAYAEAIGDEPQSYEDWLAKIKGEKGDKGEDGAPGKDGEDGEDGAPGKDGEDGTIWYTGLAADRESNTKVRTGDFYLETDTLDFYVKTEDGWTPLGSLQGQAGSHIYVGSNAPLSNAYPNAVEGDIYISTTTGLVYVYNGSSFISRPDSLKGPQGDPGTNGKNGNAWFTSDGDPNVAEIGGVNGDFCLDTKNCAIYQKQSGTWKLICKFQGTSSGGETEDPGIEEYSYITDNTTAVVPDSGPGWYKVRLKTGEAELTEDQIKSLRVTPEYCVDKYLSTLNFMTSGFELSAESTAAKHVYFAVVPKSFVESVTTSKDKVMDDAKEQKVKFSGVTGDIKGKVTVEKWEPATVSSLGQKFDFFYCNYASRATYKSIFVDLAGAYSSLYGEVDSSLEGFINGSAFFFDQSIYEQISEANLKLEYGDGAFTNVNKLPEFVAVASKYYWIGDKAGTKHAAASGAQNWNELTTKFTYNKIDNPTATTEKYFFELCVANNSGTAPATYKLNSEKLTRLVPLQLKVTKAE